MTITEAKKISEYEWEIPKQGGMKVPARIFASEKLMQKIKQDRTLMQAANVAWLQGIQKFSYVMPDAHEGYGFPIGGVAGIDTEDGVISPGGIGYDINCGVRLLRTDFTAEEVVPKLKQLLNELFTQIPSGVGRGGQTQLSKDEMLEMLVKGSKWSLEHGYGKKEDLEATEEYGYLKNAEPSFVSDSAIKRGKPQLGTLGAGNHFLEVQKVAEIYDEKTAAAFGIEKPGQVTVMVHCGSRGFGHQVASDYIREMEKKYGFSHLPDRELVNAPFNSELGQKYFGAMLAGMNYAFANRQMIVHWMRNSFKKVMGTDDGMRQVYDVCHNIAKVEKHKVDGSVRELCVHRKGATRSFGPGRDEVNDMYKKTGQPVFIPGTMSTASYVLVGTEEAEEKSFGSTAHGAGRAMSRAEAIHTFRGERVAREMEQMSILVKAASWQGIAEEAAPAYKDIDEVVRVSDKVGLGRAVAKLIPLGVVKG